VIVPAMGCWDEENRMEASDGGIRCGTKKWTRKEDPLDTGGSIGSHLLDLRGRRSTVSGLVVDSRWAPPALLQIHNL
jgi:hypothetical protein